MWVDVTSLKVYCDTDTVRITGQVVKRSASVDQNLNAFCIRWNKALSEATAFFTETMHDEFTIGKEVIDFNELANILIGVSDDT